MAASLTLAYLCVMGDLRRLLSLVGAKPTIDPFLLISPIMAVLIAIPLLVRVKTREPLSKAMLFLTLVMGVELLNPVQGGLSVSLAGFIYAFVPALWFWAARRYATISSTTSFMYSVFLPISVAAALLGLYQNFFGFLPWEQAWIDEVKSTYTALFAGGDRARSFGFSVSGAEYATVLLMGSIVVVGGMLSGRRAYVIYLLPLLPALLLSSSRGSVIRFFVAVAVMWGLRKGKSMSLQSAMRIFVPLALLLGLMVAVASRFEPESSSPSAAQTATEAAVSHQAGGLADPTSGKSSTAGLHSQMFLKGVWQGVVFPIGHGTGASTSGGDAKTGSGAFFSEVDISDAFINYGVGGVLFVVFVIRVLTSAFKNPSRFSRSWSLPLVGLLAGNVGGWLIGGQYCTACILFYLAGSIAKQEDLLARGSELPR